MFAFFLLPPGGLSSLAEIPVQPLLPQRWVPGQSPPGHIRHIPPRAFQGHAYPIAPAVVQVTRDRQGVSGPHRPRQRRSIETLPPIRKDHPRSEEHTSELQSPCNLVCRLLLEKKK